MKSDFSPFEVGMVFNALPAPESPVDPVASAVTIEYPSRLEAMALDPSKIVENHNMVYPAGQIDFSAALYKRVTARLLEDTDEVIATSRTPRASLVRHGALLMRAALGFRYGIELDVEDAVNLRHCGLGSSSGLVAATAASINELFGNPVGPLDLARYCAQNHGEEIDGADDRLVPVQCIGGSALCGYFEGGLVVVAGESTPIFRRRLPESLKVVLGVPDDFEHPDSEALMQAEVDNIDGFRQTGASFADRIAYRLIHEVLPGLVADDLKPCKDLIFDYRWDMGSIRNCSFVYPRMTDIAEGLRDLKDDERAAILSLSSVGPGFFALTDDPDYIVGRFEAESMTTLIAAIHNDRYTVVSKEAV